MIQKIINFFASETIIALKSRVFDLERELFESNAWARIGEEKVREWVTKHDELLIKHKEHMKSHDENVEGAQN